MSEHKVEIVKIDDVVKHPQADRLDIVQVKGWCCVTQKDAFKVGDLAVYIPIDSVLGERVESLLFGPDAKIKLSKSRVKTIKIRGAISQGMAVAPSTFADTFDTSDWRLGDDVAKQLDIQKYEPPDADTNEAIRTSLGVSSNGNNPHFKKYTDIQHLKNHMHMFAEGEMVSVTEKLHGTSARYGCMPAQAHKWWQKVLKFFHLLPQYEFCYGSRNVQLQGKSAKQLYYSTDVYAKVGKKLELDRILAPGEELFGEIVAEGIQKNYSYGYTKNDPGFYAYDVSIDGVFLNPYDFRLWCVMRGIPFVPVLYEGPANFEKFDKLRQGDSTIGGQKVREGIVIKPAVEGRCPTTGRKVAKFINDEYLLGDQTEFH